MKLIEKGIVGYVEGFDFFCPKCDKAYDFAIFYKTCPTKASCIVCESDMLIKKQWDHSKLVVKFTTEMDEYDILAAIEKKVNEWKTCLECGGPTKGFYKTINGITFEGLCQSCAEKASKAFEEE